MSSKLRRVLALGVVLLIYGAYVWLERSTAPDQRPTPGQATTPAFAEGDKAVLAAYQEQRSGVMVEVEAEVIKLLPDDLDPPRHQRFLVALRGGHTLLISHNTDLAPHVPLAEGDRAYIRGQYEWNDRGGVVHWTHHDPRGKRRGGFIRHRGEEYR